MSGGAQNSFHRNARLRANLYSRMIGGYQNTFERYTAVMVETKQEMGMHRVNMCYILHLQGSYAECPYTH